MSGSARPSLPARVLEVAGVGVVIVLALVVILTALRTELPRTPGVMSDALGPDAGESVAEYLDRAAASLVVDGGETAVVGGGGAGADRSGAPEGHEDDNDDDNAPSPDLETPRWALVSAEEAWTAADAEAVARDLPRVSTLMVQVPVEGVAMPVTEVVLAEPVAGEASRLPGIDRGLGRAADALAAAAPASTGPSAGSDTAPSPPAGAAAEPGVGVGTDRAAETAALTAARIRSGAPSVIGLLVRATPAQLREVAGRPGVRAVEALPADAVWGRFAVRPLQPQQRGSASPLPDTAPVPAR